MILGCPGSENINRLTTPGMASCCDADDVSDEPGIDLLHDTMRGSDNSLTRGGSDFVLC